MVDEFGPEKEEVKPPSEPVVKEAREVNPFSMGDDFAEFRPIPEDEGDIEDPKASSAPESADFSDLIPTAEQTSPETPALSLPSMPTVSQPDAAKDSGQPKPNESGTQAS
jgi:hypothetical protein